MGKFIITNILIDKSSKDINTGIKYDFTQGLNVIYGENEAGKSSLMKFIKEGFFKQKGLDSGKIWFQINKNEKSFSYRADINTAKPLEQRCKIYNSDENIECPKDIIDNEINKTYFEQGFYINLDDLMKIQNKSVSELVDLIKDPYSDKIKNYSDKIEDNIQQIIGKDGKLKKDFKDIANHINELNNKIIELSQRENQYNTCLKNIENLNNEFETITKKEEYISVLENLKNDYSSLEDKTEQLKKLKSEFNQKLFEAQKNISEIFENSGIFYSNQKLIERNNQKLEETENNIKSEKDKLISNYQLSLDDETLINFVIIEDNIFKLKNIIKEISELKAEIKTTESRLEDIENEILKTDIRYKSFVKDYLNSDLNYIKTLSNDIEKGLEEYYALGAEINNDEKNLKELYNIAGGKNILIYGIIIFLIISGLIISAYNKLELPSIILAVTAFTASVIFGYILYSGNNKQKKSQIINKKNALEKLLADLKDKAINFDKNFLSNSNDYSLHIKLNNLNQHLKEIIKNNSDKEQAAAKKNIISTKLKELGEKLQNLNNEADLYTDKTISQNRLNPENYIEVIDIIRNLKKELAENENLLKEIKEAENTNNNIVNNIKNFTDNTELILKYTGDMKIFTEKLDEVSTKNSALKKDIEIQETSINELKEKIQTQEDKKLKFEAETSFKIDLNETETQKEILNKAKDDILTTLKSAEYQKQDLEKLGNMNDIKSQKRIFIDKYRNAIKSLLINKMQANIISSAKKDFDKTQPDLVNAQKYLFELTNKKYNKINLELQEIETTEGKVKKWDELSRGTKEQLYLALRLGFASNYSKDKITLIPNGKSDLPLIIDDAFVNFDINRTKNTLKCLEEFSKTNQVLYFTCHKPPESENLKYNKINL